jgi:PKD repeat protein
MGSNLTKFEASIEKSLDGFELPYDPKGWEDMEQRLNAAGQSGSSNLLIAGLIAASIVAATGSYLYFALSSSGYAGMLAEQSVQIKEPFSRDKLCKISPEDKSILQNSNTADYLLEADRQNDLQNSSTTPLPTNTSSSSASQNELAAQNKSGRTKSTTEKSSADDAKSTTTSETQGHSSNLTPEELESQRLLAFVPSITEACQGMTVDFRLSTGLVEGSYLWNFGDGQFSSDPNPSHTYSKAGVYDISLSVTSKNDGQMRSTTKEKLIVINPKPHAEFGWEFVNGPGEIPHVAFTNESQRANECEWVFDEVLGTKDINPAQSYTTAGRHEVKLTVTNDFGCVDDKYAYIYVDADYNLGAPSGFSPNGDHNNNTFLPEALRNNNHKFKLTIYDDMQPVFESTSKKNPWDGKLPNGEVALSGTSYPWVVIIYNAFGEEEKYFSGTITITP